MIFKMCQRTPPAEAIIALSVAVSGAGSAKFVTKNTKNAEDYKEFHQKYVFYLVKLL